MSNEDAASQSVKDDSVPQRRRSSRLSSPIQTTKSMVSEDKKESSQSPTGRSVRNKSKMASPEPPQPTLTKVPPVAKRSTFVVRKIQPRKTTVILNENKENVQRPSGGNLQSKPKMSTPGTDQVPLPKPTTLSPIPAPAKASLPKPALLSPIRSSPRVAPPKPAPIPAPARVSAPKPAMLSPIRSSPRVAPPKPAPVRVSAPKPTILSPIRSSPRNAPPEPAILSPILAPLTLSNHSNQAPAEPQEEDLVWSQKVRRSYSRLSPGNQSLDSSQLKALSSSTSQRRETLFGFEKLQTPEVVRKRGRSGEAEVSASLWGTNSFTTLLEAEQSGSLVPELDMDIPGVALVKEKKRRKKVTQIKVAELDALAAQMNAEFEEAEGFELLIE